jgi:hypothetical protein
MPNPTCYTSDPVELLLKRILKRAIFLAGASAAGACAGGAEGELGEAHLQAMGGEYCVNPPDASRDAGGPDAGEGGVDYVIVDAGPPLGPALPCVPGKSSAIHAAGLKTASPYDYLVLRQESWSGPTGGGGAGAVGAGAGSPPAPIFEVLSETGTACATAQSPACAEQLARGLEPYKMGCSQVGCVRDSLVTTRGDGVQSWTNIEALKTLLGPIDAPDEALLMLDLAGHAVICGSADETSLKAVAGGYEAYVKRHGYTCVEPRPKPIFRDHLFVSISGEITVLRSVVVGEEAICTGRKPVGLRSRGRDRGESKLGDYLARCAHLEAASVVSFERLASELEAYAAPRPLIDAALAARADEVRHAELVGDLARARGGEPVEPEVAALSLRSLEEIALENAVEGCVRETYGALVGGYQAEHASDPQLGAGMAELAEDEGRHAALAHGVNRWIMEKLDAGARQRVVRAQRRAIVELVCETAQNVDPELRMSAGLPSPQLARLLIGELMQQLWADQLDSSAADSQVRASA